MSLVPLPSVRQSLARSNSEYSNTSPTSEKERELEKGNVVLPQEQQLERKDGGWAAWRFIASGFVLDGLVWGLTYSFGSYEAYYIKTELFGASPLAYSVIGTTTMALDYALMLPGLILCRVFPHRIHLAMRLFIAVYVVSLLIASFANNVATLVVFQGIGPGLAGGLLWSSVYLHLNQWFDKRIALAGGVLFGGSALTGFGFPIFITYLCETIGFRWSLRVFALIVLIFGGVGVMGIVAREPVVKPTSIRWPKMDWRFLLAPMFYCFVAITGLQGAAYSCVMVYLPTYAYSFSAFYSGLALSSTNLAGFFGQIAVGYFSDRINNSIVMATCLVMMCISIFVILRVAENVSMILGFAVLIGFFGSGFSSTWFAAARDINALVKGRKAEDVMDESSTREIFALNNVVIGIFSMLGPTFAGMLYQDPLNMAGEGNTVWGKRWFGGFVQLNGFLSVGALFFVGLLELARRRRLSHMEVANQAQIEVEQGEVQKKCQV